jgi:recombination protein RecR
MGRRRHAGSDYSSVAGLIAPVARLIEELNRLPGVGQKTAQRLAYHVLRTPPDEARALAAALVAVKEEVAYCSVCCNITEVGVDPCAICSDSRRDAARICVVEEPLDVLAIERTGEFRGRYHVLHGAISPIDGIGPERIRAQELLERAVAGGIEEVILATNPNLEGEATAMYLADQLTRYVPLVSRIARGLPVGGDLEYADDVTLIRSLQGRRPVDIA